ncbi:hypothetical protein GLW30_15570 [Halorubrum terrestre]|uniref:Envelope protein N-terminal domain-containing protein n=2 Tax=Halorubrum distributum TaxID=29283 RepID=A0A6B1IPE1_9EURY|nr:hypothetical protein [Halorubrum terrestre]
MTATQPDSTRTISRRGVLRTTAVGIGAAAGMGAIGSTAGTVRAVDWGSVGTTAALGVLSPPLALGWALREFEVIGSDPPAEGLTPDVLKQQVYQTAQTRKSTNASTVVDNQNILDGVENNAYTEAKIAAIEELNAGSTESAVLDAANSAIDSYETTVKKNLIKSWNESVREWGTLVSTIESHSDLSIQDVINSPAFDTYSIQGVGYNTNSYNYPDGTSTDLLTIDFGSGGNGLQNWDLTQKTNSGNDPSWNIPLNAWEWTTGHGTIVYLDYDDWNPIYSDMDTKFQNVRDGISTWVTNVYSEVQSGEIEISELLTPRERAAMLSDEETEAQAIADLAALNIPIDSEREVTITITETDATLSGTLGLSDESDGPIEVGTTYDPSSLSGDVYLTADVSQISGGWTEYETGVDGGTITLTAEPYDGVNYGVTTAAGETVSVPSDSWNATGSGTWTYDASGELETTITEVESIEYSSSATEAQIETLRLTRQFTVESITNRETGEEVTAASFESSEPQTDSNYITQEEWNQLEQQNQELIDKYEKSQNTGGAGGGFFPDGGPSTGVIAAVVGGIGVAYALFGQGDN